MLFSEQYLSKCYSHVPPIVVVLFVGLTKMDTAEPGQNMDNPAQSFPEGVTPDFFNPDSIAYQVYITAGVCLALMMAFSLTRLLSKIYFGPRTIKIDESENLQRFGLNVRS